MKDARDADREVMEGFRKEVEKAEKEGKDSFDFSGETITVEYARQVLEYIEKEGGLIEAAIGMVEKAQKIIERDHDRKLAMLAKFFKKIGFDKTDIAKLFDHIAGEIRERMDDEQLTDFDEMTDDERRGFITEAIVEGHIRLSAIEVPVNDSPDNSETVH